MQTGPYAGEGGCDGCKHTPLGINYFNFMQLFTKNRIYTPNFGPKVKIFLKLAPPPLAKYLKCAPLLLLKSLRTGLFYVDCKTTNCNIVFTHIRVATLLPLQLQGGAIVRLFQMANT